MAARTLARSGDTRATTTQAYQRIDVRVGDPLQRGGVRRLGERLRGGERGGGDGWDAGGFDPAARLELRWPVEATLPIPPVGEGWFDNLYVDDTLRVARDSRGDTLVVVRDDFSKVAY